jgi:large subunit ribosomal protein L13
MQTFFPSGANLEAQRKWYVVDAEGQTVGRLSARIASILRGKHKPTFTPFIDMGDHVVIINAEKIVFTANKLETKLYRHHTGYPGGLKETTGRDLLARYPERILEQSIKGMLPKNKLGRAMAKKLKVYAGPVHPHEAQKPEPLKLA